MAKLTKPARDRISATKFAFPKQRKEPLENASHVRNAVARFNQVKGTSCGVEANPVGRKTIWSGTRKVRLARTHVARLPWQRERDGSTMGCLASKSRVVSVCNRAEFGTKF